MFYFSSIFLLIPSVFLFFQVSTYYQNDSIDFVRLEELKSPSVVRGLEGENGQEW